MTAPTITLAQPTSLAANRNFRLLWLGEGVSVLGSMTTTVVFPLIAVTEFSAGPLAMGLLAGAVWLPWLVLGLPVGAVVDRSDPRGPGSHPVGRPHLESPCVDVVPPQVTAGVEGST